MSAVVGVGHRQLDGDLQHVLAEQRHPGGAVGLLEVAAGRQRRAAVEDADVVEAQEAPLEDVPARAVLAVDPPGEVQQQLLEAALEPLPVPLAALRRFEAVGEDGRPGVDRRVDVAEVPLVGRDLAVGVHVPLAQHQLELLLAEVGVDERQGEDVEGEVPGRVPGVFPLVGHRDDVAVVHVVPVVVARGGLPRRLERVGPALLQPLVDVVVVELLGPEHPRQGLPHHVGRVGVQRGRDDGGVELVRLGPPRLEDLVEARRRTAPRRCRCPGPRPSGRRRRGAAGSSGTRRGRPSGGNGRPPWSRSSPGSTGPPGRARRSR